MTDTEKGTPENKPAPKKRPPMRRRRQRLLVVSLLLPTLAVASFFVLIGISQTSVYFYAPKDLPSPSELDGRAIRIGGMVAEGTIKQGEGLETWFDVTDYEGTVTVVTNDPLPGIFRENQGVVIQGNLNNEGIFVASQVMAKHDENYMPPEVAAALKATGRYEDYMEKQEGGY
ncbi:MAG: cytochrome c maturation protein CcmE [Aquisalinus sp.]|nr:cytochrome c maturation protein CcmE [Aquisalinus sp.]